MSYADPLPERAKLLTLRLDVIPLTTGGGMPDAWPWALGVVTDGRDAMRGIFVGVADGGALGSLRTEACDDVPGCWATAGAEGMFDGNEFGGAVVVVDDPRVAEGSLVDRLDE